MEKQTKNGYWRRACWIAKEYTTERRTMLSIATELGISESRVGQIIKDQTGVEARPRGGYHQRNSLTTQE